MVGQRAKGDYNELQDLNPRKTFLAWTILEDKGTVEFRDESVKN